MFRVQRTKFSIIIQHYILTLDEKIECFPPLSPANTKKENIILVSIPSSYYVCVTVKIFLTPAHYLKNRLLMWRYLREKRLCNSFHCYLNVTQISERARDLNFTISRRITITIMFNRIYKKKKLKKGQ